jgi:hypothetical protein
MPKTRRRHHLENLKADLLAGPHMKVQTEFDDLNALLDVDRTRTPIDCVGHQDAGMAEPKVIVFELGRPMMPECPFDAAARGPAEALVQAFKAKGDAGETAGGGVFAAFPRGAAIDVEQHAIHRISQTHGYARKEIRPRRDNRRVAGETRREPDGRVAFHG